MMGTGVAMSRRTGRILDGIRQLVATPTSLTDAELLERFVRERDQAAFAAIMERHGGMVLAVCRRVLGQLHDTEDACQATFLVLARKAARIRQHGSLAGWLHRVAFSVAADLRRTRARQRGHEVPAEVAAADTTDEITWRELRTVLDEELQRLPERYRVPLILCYLEGKTRDEAAAELRWSVGTVKGRLERGRERLRALLVRRNVVLSAALFSGAIAASSGTAALPAVLAVATTRAALATGPMAASHIPAGIAALVEGAIHAMFVKKVKVVAAVLLLIGMIAGGAGVARSRGTPSAQTPEERRAHGVTDSEKNMANNDAGKNVGPSSWSGVFERQMPFDGADDAGLLDLDTGEWVVPGLLIHGRYLTPKKPAADLVSSPLLSDTRTRHALNMVVVKIPNERFSKATPDEIHESLAGKAAKESQIVGLPDSAYYFKTAAGSIGVMEIVPIENANGAVTVRWKLVRQADKGAPANEPAWGKSVLGLQIALVPDWQGPVSVGSKISYRVLLRNTTTEDIEIAYAAFGSVLPTIKREADRPFGTATGGLRSGVQIEADGKQNSLRADTNGVITGRLAHGVVIGLRRPDILLRPLALSRSPRVTQPTLYADSNAAYSLSETLDLRLTKAPTEKLTLTTSVIELVIGNENNNNGLNRNHPAPKLTTDLHSALRIFVKQQGFEGMPYSQANAQFDKKLALPILYQLLENPDCAPDWGRIANLIGYLGPEPASAPVLIKYFRRSDDQHWRSLERTSGYKAVLQKIEALRWLGLVGGKEVGPVLRQALTKDGAVSLAKDWLDSLLLATFKPMDRDRAIALIQGRAAMGIVYTQTVEDIALVERAYRLEDAHFRKNGVITKLYSELVTAMATRDLIAAKGLDGYLQLQGTGKSFQAIRPYISKYSWPLQKSSKHDR
jgi:RNA polymerase sigma factor (sigma-70 family)